MTAAPSVSSIPPSTVERRALALAGEVVELRSLVAETSDRNARLQAEIDVLQAEAASYRHHFGAFLRSLGCETVEDLRARLDVAAPRGLGAAADLEALFEERRRRPH